MRDFYRAAAQRSKWARESLLLDGETADYDERLKDRWARRFDADCSGLDNDDEAGSLDAGRKIFFWASQMQIGSSETLSKLGSQLDRPMGYQQVGGRLAPEIPRPP